MWAMDCCGISSPAATLDPSGQVGVAARIGVEGRGVRTRTTVLGWLVRPTRQRRDALLAGRPRTHHAPLSPLRSGAATAKKATERAGVTKCVTKRAPTAKSKANFNNAKPRSFVFLMLLGAYSQVVCGLEMRCRATGCGFESRALRLAALYGPTEPTPSLSLVGCEKTSRSSLQTASQIPCNAADLLYTQIRP